MLKPRSAVIEMPGLSSSLVRNPDAFVSSRSEIECRDASIWCMHVHAIKLETVLWCILIITTCGWMHCSGSCIEV